MGYEMSEPDDSEIGGDDATERPALSGRRAAMKKVGLAAGVAGAAWAAPAINGTSVVPAVAGAQTTLPPIVVGNPQDGFCADKTLDGNAYEPPPGYKCKMKLHNGNTGVEIYDTGYVSNPINAPFPDTGGQIFITPAQFPDGQDKVCAVIECVPA